MHLHVRTTLMQVAKVLVSIAVCSAPLLWDCPFRASSTSCGKRQSTTNTNSEKGKVQ